MNFLKLAFILFLPLACSNAQQTATKAPTGKTTQVTVHFTGLNTGTAKLLGVYADQNYLADTAVIASDGTAIFNKKDGFTEGYYYLLLPDKQNFQFIIANGENPVFTADKNNLAGSIAVQNSEENVLFISEQQKQIQLEANFNALNAQYKANPALGTEIKKQQQALVDERDARLAELKKNNPGSFYVKYRLAGQNPKVRLVNTSTGTMDTIATLTNYKNDWWNDFDFSDSRLIYTPVFHTKLKKYLFELTQQNNDSLISSAEYVVERAKANPNVFKYCLSWITYQYRPTQTTYMDGEAVYAALIDKYYYADKVNWETPEDLKGLHETAKKIFPSTMGKIGQDVRAKDKNNAYKSLYELKSKFTIVYIYNPDCEHCQEQTPQLRKIYDEWKPRGLEIFSIAANANDYKKWTEFETKYGINWTDVWDPKLESRYHEKYNIDITPEIYVLDANHKIVAKNLKAFQVPEMLTKLFAEK